MDATVDLGRFRAQRTTQIYPVILSSDSAAGLWPVSRAAQPKQFHPLLSEQTLFQETVARNRLDSGFAAPIIVASSDHRCMIEEQLRQLAAEPHCLLLEPMARNTAPAIAVAALWLAVREPDAVMLVQPSGHVIAVPAAFRSAVTAGLAAVDRGLIVVFGVRPTRPESGHSYIRAGAMLNAASEGYGVERFIEQPAPEQAARFVESGGFFWSSGIFLARAGDIVEELERLHPTLLAACVKAIEDGIADGGSVALAAGAFAEAPSLSLERVLMERTRRAAIVPVEMGWSDVGSWQALRDVATADADGNVAIGDVLLEEVRDSYVRSTDRLVAMVGIDNVTVVTTPDAVLVAGADAADKVPRIVERMQQRNRAETMQHTTTHRPWGYYRTVDAGERFQVKRLMVKPGAKLSLQMHFHRAEHWVVVRGTAMVERGKERLLLRENESIYIPCGVEHRLENPGKLPLHLIEVQSGAYLGEDDIVRLADNYGRA